MQTVTRFFGRDPNANQLAQAQQQQLAQPQPQANAANYPFEQFQQQYLERQQAQPALAQHQFQQPQVLSQSLLNLMDIMQQQQPFLQPLRSNDIMSNEINAQQYQGQYQTQPYQTQFQPQAYQAQFQQPQQLQAQYQPQQQQQQFQPMEQQQQQPINSNKLMGVGFSPANEVSQVKFTSQGLNYNF